ncbi:DUF4291 domain-containing protein [Mucilaginibacter sp. Bleaf8]|uniref:DUF4291 domain-containing protein n=1 Tax=Mucilaginibacter sp. Bleaf8 TaxID=2834430 RepID=UPI001BCCFF80|nr:DUF4291 domain-containing protein [Mucilaginibacter sp. Bleaf8]MBS7564252.1 DUF4291 domain-containing protein [Mucilaginibacter sp. Bleaf8]
MPQTGQHILAHQTESQIIVYQAYKASIAAYSLKNQSLGGPDFSFNRMSWIKPNFLWMMYRCGWAEKENQEHILAISIEKKDFEKILKQAVYSSFNPKYYESYEQWKSELALKDVRLQWDPDHDPFGNKLERRAIQIGLKGEALNYFIEHIKSIEDITSIVRQQKYTLDNAGIEKLLVPVETIFRTSDEELNNRIGI